MMFSTPQCREEDSGMNNSTTILCFRCSLYSTTLAKYAKYDVCLHIVTLSLPSIATDAETRRRTVLFTDSLQRVIIGGDGSRLSCTSNIVNIYVYLVVLTRLDFFYFELDLNLELF